MSGFGLFIGKMPTADLPGGLESFLSSWPWNQLSAAIRTNGIHGTRTRFAKCAFIAADEGRAGATERGAALLALSFHFKRHEITSAESLSRALPPLAIGDRDR